MKQKKVVNLLLLCGPSGAGKSTFVKSEIEKTHITCEVISRDAIRFSLLNEDEDYFAHENEVFEKFIEEIQNKIDTLKDNSCIFVDATHLTEKSRNKTLDRLKLDNVRLYAVNMKISLKECLKRNENRKGIGRAYVPPSVIKRMYYSFKPADNNEKYKYKNIYNIGEDGKTI